MLKQVAAFGFRAHSGWAVMIALAAPMAAPIILRRCRIELADRGIAGSVQPYHAAQRMPLNGAETYLRSCAETTAAMAKRAVRNALAELTDYEVKGACVLLAAGRRLPGLADILASHAMIHTAEGEFYRVALRDACTSCGLTEIGVRERDLMTEATRALGRSAEDLQRALAGFGKAVGAPWRQDEKLSALAAWLVLGRCM